MYRLLVLPIALLSFTLPVFALPESALEKGGWEKSLSPFLATGRPIEFTGEDGVVLKGVRFTHLNPTATLIFLPGFSEPWLKYIELLHDLHLKGYEILSYDHRGQGSSPRLAPGNPDAVHLVRFEDHVSDLGRFLAASGAKNFHLLGHSMGGAVALSWAETRTPPSSMRILVNAPMLAIRTDPFPRPLAHLLASILTGIGLGEHYAPTKGPRDPDRPFESNHGTSSRIRYEFEKNLSRRFPDRWVGGPTNSWVKSALDASGRIARDSSRIRNPVWMLVPSDDHYAVPKELLGICHGLGRLCQAIPLEGSRHEVFVESDLYRTVAITAVLDSLKN